MKKSEIYTVAMKAVLACELNCDETLEILDVLMSDKHMAELVEKAEQEKEAV